MITRRKKKGFHNVLRLPVIKRGSLPGDMGNIFFCSEFIMSLDINNGAQAYSSLCENLSLASKRLSLPSSVNIPTPMLQGTVIWIYKYMNLQTHPPTRRTTFQVYTSQTTIRTSVCTPAPKLNCYLINHHLKLINAHIYELESLILLTYIM